MRNAARLTRLKLRAGDKLKKTRVAVKQRKLERHVVDKQKKTFDEVLKRS